MKLMIIGVFGHAGRAIFKEAQRRGHTVTGVAHRKHAHPLVANLLIKDRRSRDGCRYRCRWGVGP